MSGYALGLFFLRLEACVLIGFAIAFWRRGE